MFVIMISVSVSKLQIPPQKINLTKPTILHEMAANKPYCHYVAP